MSDSPNYVTWKGLLGVLAPFVLGGFAGVWALFSSQAPAPSVSEHDSSVRRIENLERRVDALWQRPTHTKLTIDGEEFEGEVYGTPFDEEVFRSQTAIAIRQPDGIWKIVWRKKDD